MLAAPTQDPVHPRTRDKSDRTAISRASATSRMPPIPTSTPCARTNDGRRPSSNHNPLLLPLSVSVPIAVIAAELKRTDVGALANAHSTAAM